MKSSSNQVIENIENSQDETIVLSRFTDNPDGSFLREEQWAKDYEQITSSSVYRPGQVEEALIKKQQNELVTEANEVIIMLAPGNCEQKEVCILENHPKRENLEIISLEWSMEQADKTEKILQWVGDRKNNPLKHKPSFHIIPREKAWLKTFNRTDSKAITYTSLGFNIAMQDLEKTAQIWGSLFRTRLQAQDNIIFSYHQTPSGTTREEAIKKTLKAYNNTVSKKFVFWGVKRQLQKLWIMFDAREREYDVHYNHEKDQVEIGIKSKNDWRWDLPSWSKQFKTGEKINVYISRRSKDRQVDNMLEKAQLRRKKTREENGVVLVVADAKPRLMHTLYYLGISLTLILILGITRIQYVNQTKKQIQQNLERIDRKKNSEKSALTRYCEFGALDTLTGEELAVRRQQIAQEIASHIVNIYNWPESAHKTLELIISDKIQEFEDRANSDDKRSREIMFFICNDIIPQVQSLLASYGWSTRAYSDFDDYEQHIYNTLFDKQQRPSNTNTGPAYALEWEDFYVKKFWPYTVLPIDRNYWMMRENKFYTDGWKIYVKPEFADEYESDEIMSGYAWYDSSDFAKSVLRWIVFRKYKVLHKAFDILCERHERWYKDPQIAEELVNIRLEKYVHRWYEWTNANSPSDAYIQTVVEDYESKHPFSHEIQQHQEAMQNTRQYIQQQTHNVKKTETPIPNFLSVTDLSQYWWTELRLYTTSDGTTYTLYEIQWNDGKLYLVWAKKHKGEARESIQPYVGPEEIQEVIREQMGYWK